MQLIDIQCSTLGANLVECQRFGLVSPVEARKDASDHSVCSAGNCLIVEAVFSSEICGRHIQLQQMA